MKCPRCGMENPDGEKLCQNCNTVLESIPQETPTVTNSYAPKNIPQGLSGATNRKRTKAETVIFSLLHALFYVLLYFTIQFTVSLVFEVAVAIRYNIDLTTEAGMRELSEIVMANAVMLSLVSNLIAIFAVCFMQTMRKKSVKNELRIHGVNIMRIPSFAIYGLSLNLFISCTITILPIPENLVQSFDSQYSSIFADDNLFLQISSIAVVTAIIEEMVFRGLVISRLRRGMNKFIAIAISAVIFGVVHWTPIAIAYATLLGVIFGIMYLMYDSIVPSIVCHLFFNLTSLVISGMQIPFLPVYVLSIVGVIFFTHRIFFRYPTFSDILADRKGKIRGKNEEENKLFDEIRDLRNREMVGPEDIEQLNDKFDEIMSRRQKTDKK